MDEHAEALARNLCVDMKSWRLAQRLKQKHAAEALGITQPYLSQIENGKRPNISFVLYQKMRLLYKMP